MPSNFFAILRRKSKKTTKMRIPDIQIAFANLVGWSQSYNPENKIDSSLTASSSGLYFQDGHPLVTLENIASIMPPGYELQFPNWEAGTYVAGSEVTHDGKFWRATIPTNEEPQAPDWVEFKPLSKYLGELTSKSIADTLARFNSDKVIAQKSKNLLSNRTWFKGIGRHADNIMNNGRFVGMEIQQKQTKGVTIKIDRIGLQFVRGNGPITLYLFHSSKMDPVETATVNYSDRAGSYQWFELGWDLPYLENTGQGYWYVGYNQNELPGLVEAVNFIKDWNSEPCGTCVAGQIEDWRAMSKYMKVTPFYVTPPSDFETDPVFWGSESNIYTPGTNYGINVEYSVYCDLTTFIVRQKQVFTLALQKTLAYNVLKLLANNPNVRVNRNVLNASRLDLGYEMEGDPQGRKTGLSKDIDSAFKTLDIDTTGIAEICLACAPKRVNFGIA